LEQFKKGKNPKAGEILPHAPEILPQVEILPQHVMKLLEVSLLGIALIAKREANPKRVCLKEP
jgi:hypothetical protein